MSVNITPAMRVEQYPDEFMVKKNGLWCKWCDRVINHCRKDNMNEHMWSRAHQDARVEKGARISYDPESEEALERRKRRSEKAARSKQRQDERKKRMRQQQQRKTQSVDSSSEEEDNDTDLRQLFEDSDSDSSSSFEGFNEPAPKKSRKRTSKYTDDEDSRRSGRPRKRPARLDDSLGNDDIARIGKIADQAAFVSSMARRRTEEEEYSSPSSSDLSPLPRIRSMPIKKQISYSARQSDSTSPVTSPTKGSLKMKFSRASRSSQEYSIEKGKKLKVVSGSGPGDGLKLKFVWKKKQKGRSSEDTDSKDTDEDSRQNNNGVPQGYEEMLRGITEGASVVGETQIAETEVVEEEIVDMNNEDVVLEEDWVPPDPEVIPEIKEEVRDPPVANIRSTKESLAHKTKQIKKMAKSIKRGHFKSRRAKKDVPVDEKRRKTTGYMLWAKQMREKVSKQYPGLEFGDVSKKLGDLWKKIPDKEKQMWKYRNLKIEKQINMGTFRRSGSKMIETGPKKKPPPPIKTHMTMAAPPVKNPEAAMKNELQRFPAPSMEPIDSAAYFCMLGESFEKLGSKARKLDSKASVQGAESLLLDSLVSALGPLLSLTRQIPELENALDHKRLSHTLSNIAHIMPGL